LQYHASASGVEICKCLVDENERVEPESYQIRNLFHAIISLVIRAAAKIDAEISNRLRFILPPHKSITSWQGNLYAKHEFFKVCIERTVKLDG
jgi:hypothetical protein